ncbi:4-(cytidine 5'-diphospho)-2-C-methyl-D-erythritol kinase [Nocardioides sp. CER19]|uniref:4-(cytidine 5'-diphospho)-2-C-methyl-D-erythritol kinase n=1 Tax=Nocardioides sp. CER19 TaxID=3038538 RepID=UPI00244821A9|nr:4-(cytidine 5'-diphospho)-2-C-methyl-D-erythritol kinase [Nocardioides sp. CER19]MDH2414692.1 4-(cytidine 5'-diphospho)-2-C-methyl-D-erythritol kinase [Nocardioides sp. CER19]
MSELAEPESSAVTVRAAAKINLHLGVGRVRGDGFHPLATVYQAIGLYDDVTVAEAADWSVHTVADDGIDLAAVPDDETNIAIRAGRALTAHHGVALTAQIQIHKGIPVAGGMAGGSADAAATLVALDRLWGLETPDDDLLAIAADLGSDVPFALLGGTAIGSGRGELVTPVADATELWWIVVPHPEGLSTPAVYRHFDALVERGVVDAADPEVPADLLDALAAGESEALGAELSNDLAAAAYDLRPDLVEVRRRLEAIGANAVLLSGSGPTHLMLYDDVEGARAAAAELVDAGIGHWLAPAPVAGCHVVDLL